ncbi:hypothetical protein Slala02_30730 [Streptomyces lavendulae subsp. lavendulae]|nr:hypothetical protein Slala01_34020 [Streptomyces lavendulae subsp. lavendulae]GLX27253.1 hypothetical protein Slala02_30730 [Streptomyces lavendulae subsp. lavendulae]
MAPEVLAATDVSAAAGAARLTAAMAALAMETATALPEIFTKSPPLIPLLGTRGDLAQAHTHQQRKIGSIDPKAPPGYT